MPRRPKPSLGWVKAGAEVEVPSQSIFVRGDLGEGGRVTLPLPIS